MTLTASFVSSAHLIGPGAVDIRGSSIEALGLLQSLPLPRPPLTDFPTHVKLSLCHRLLLFRPVDIRPSLFFSHRPVISAIGRWKTAFLEAKAKPIGKVPPISH